MFLKMKQRTRLMQNGDEVAFSMGNKKDDGDHIQLYKVKPTEHFIEAQVQEGDTLQAIALRFYCSISELKRINHIHKDNEIFARRTIKVPVTPYSVLTECIPTHPPQESLTSSNINQPNSIIDELFSNEMNLKLLDSIPSTSIQKDDECAIDCNAVVMNSTMAPAVLPYTDAEPAEYVTEDTHLLPNKEKMSVEAVVVKQLTSQGADFGLKWFHLVCVMLVIGIVGPLVYVLFFLKIEDHEHPNLPPPPDHIE